MCGLSSIVEVCLDFGFDLSGLEAGDWLVVFGRLGFFVLFISVVELLGFLSLMETCSFMSLWCNSFTVALVR